MSFADEEEFRAFAYRDHLLPHVTAEAVGDALIGFLLTSDVSLGWLATAVRRSLAITIPCASDGPERASNSEIRKELTALAEAMSRAWGKSFDRSEAADGRLWAFAFERWEGANALATSDDPGFEYNRFSAALQNLEWLAAFLREAAETTESQVGDWRRAEERRLRIERGQLLAPIFERTFGQSVSANNWPHDARHVAPTPFMDFYQRMVALGFGEKATPDVSGVLKAACRLHRESPARFNPEMIPDLGGAQSA